MVVRKFKQRENKEVLGVDTSSRSSPLFRFFPLHVGEIVLYVCLKLARSDGNGFSICNIEGFPPPFPSSDATRFGTIFHRFLYWTRFFFSLFVISFEMNFLNRWIKFRAYSLYL